MVLTKAMHQRATSIGNTYPSLRDDNLTTMRNLISALEPDAEAFARTRELRLAMKWKGVTSAVLLVPIVLLMSGAGIAYAISDAKDDSAYAAYAGQTWLWAILAVICAAIFVSYLIDRSWHRSASARAQEFLRESSGVAFDIIMERKLTQYSQTTDATTESLGIWLAGWLVGRGATNVALGHPSPDGVCLEATECVVWLSLRDEAPGLQHVEYVLGLGATQKRTPILAARTTFTFDVSEAADTAGVALLVVDRQADRVMSGNLLGEYLLKRGNRAFQM